MADIRRRSVAYKVRKGDTLTSIANDYGVSADKIRKWNHLTGTTVKPGRVLHIYKPAAEDAEVAAGAHSKKKVAPELSARNCPCSGNCGKRSRPLAKNPTHHTVKRGETLTSIASQYNIIGSGVEEEQSGGREAASRRCAGDSPLIYS